MMEGEFDVRGKTFLITGGDKGLGLETVRRLVLGGGSVIIGCREKKFFIENSQVAKAEFCKNLNCSVTKISFLELDLSSLTSVKKFCQNVSDEFPIIDVIICNAGVMSHDGRRSKEGLEIHFSVNYLGHFLIVNSLLSILKKSQDPRVVVVSSILLKEGQIHTETLGSQEIITRYNLQSGSGSKSPAGYADSKLMCSLFANEFQKREPYISVFSVSPGWCKTGLGRSACIAWYQYPAILILMTLFGNSIKQGADSIVFCAASNRVQHLRGKFVRNRKIFEKIEVVLELHSEVSNLLWQKTKQILSELQH